MHGKDSKDVSGKRKSTFVNSFRRTISHMMVMRVSWLLQQMLLTNFGELYRNCRRKSVLKVAFLTVRQKLFRVLHLMVQDILMRALRISSRLLVSRQISH